VNVTVRKVQGFDRARKLLAREDLWESFATPRRLRAQARQVFGEELSVQQVVWRIVDDVRRKGDKALVDYTEELDGVRLNSLEVDKGEVAAAHSLIDRKLTSALKFAASRIQDFHSACEHRTGLIPIDRHLGRHILPLQNVGLYVPGGTAAYPSTVLMMAIPARVAGVKEIIMVSPPGKDGKIPAPTLVAADIAKVDRIFKVGGAQAIAALAFGTQSIPRVDKICGPGNIFVTLAKKMVYGTVDIDGLEGPSEIVIIADEKANPTLCAADLLAQAEHDTLASAVLITTSAGLAERVAREIQLRMRRLKRRSSIEKAMDGAVLVLVDDMSQAVELVNLFAPEHLSIMATDASALARRIRNAGCVFVGDSSPVALGDYVAGPSHVLPTGGSARFGSPLSVDHFLKITNVIALDKPAMRKLSQPAMEIARAEGLDAHAEAVASRVVASKAKQSGRSSSPSRRKGQREGEK